MSGGADNGRSGEDQAGAQPDDAAGDDPGEPIVADIIALFLRDISAVPAGAIEELRFRTERAGELLRRHGHDRQRAQRVVAYRLKLRRARRLLERMFEIVESDLPPDEGD